MCVALTGYGSAPGQALLPGYDALVQAESGWASLTGGPDDPPTKSGLSLADYICGLTAMVGLLAGLRDAERTGVGRDVDTNLYDSALAMLSYPATWFLTVGVRDAPAARSRRIRPWCRSSSSRPRTGTSRWRAPRSSSSRTWCGSWGCPELATDERFASFVARGRHRDEVLERLSCAVRGADHRRSGWSLLRGVVPIAPVRSMAEALDVDELTGRGMLAEYEDETFGRVRSVGLPLHVGGFEPTYRPGPSLGRRTRSWRSWATPERGRLRAAGAFGDATRRRRVDPAEV